MTQKENIIYTYDSVEITGVEVTFLNKYICESFSYNIFPVTIVKRYDKDTCTLEYLLYASATNISLSSYF